MTADVAGLVPPNDCEAEAALLSAVLIDPSAFDEVADLLHRETFYAEAHGLIWAACAALRAKGQPVDIVQVGSRLRDEGRLQQVGGMGYLTEMLNAAPAIAHRRAYAERVVEKWRLRQVANITGEAHACAYLDGAESVALLDRTETALMRLGATGVVLAGERLDPLMKRAWTDLQAAEARGDLTTGIPTGLAAYDALTGGLHRGDLTIVAGRPGMGKTSLALGWAVDVSRRLRKQPVPLGALMASLEMPRMQLAHRLLCMQGGVNVSRLRNLGTLSTGDWDRLLGAVAALEGGRFYIDDTPAQTVAGLRSLVRREKARFLREGVDLAVVVVDYLQLMRGPEGARHHREQEVSGISQGLKALAKEQGLAVVALSQLNRAVEARADKRPTLADLRESGAIEQDADNVVFVYRGAYYKRLAGEAVGMEDLEAAELVIAKQRNGPTATALARFEEQYARFSGTPHAYVREAAE